MRGAALPYKILRAHGGQEIATAQFLRELAGAQAICLGESHSNPHDHWAEWKVFSSLLEESRRAKVTLALGMEMFQRPFQGVLDDYAAGTIAEAEMLARSGWDERWGFDWALYRPIVALAVERHTNLIALNVENEVKKKVMNRGIENLSPADRGKLPREIDLDDKEHRAWWDEVMAAMGGPHNHAQATSHEEQNRSNRDREEDADERLHTERMYAVQVLWDETMADTAARWLTAGGNPSPRRQIVILAGTGHCHRVGLVRRLKKRGIERAVSVRPIVQDGGNVAELLADPENDYLFVMTAPKDMTP
jgi:uncharacterized iron-regulated protein